MKALRNAVADYMALRRSLGYKLRDMATGLNDFVSFLESKEAPYIKASLALEWATQPRDNQPVDWSRRLGYVRSFARHWSATDPRTEIPPVALIPFSAQRAHPYLYTEKEIRKLLEATKGLPPEGGLRPWTYHCLLGLLVVTGLRIGEALALERSDVDLSQGLLTIRKAKFNKTRLVPIHDSTREVLTDYASRRNRLVPARTSPCFLVDDYGRQLGKVAVWRTFCTVSRLTGLRGPADRKGPRIHDFRHRFAVNTLIRWYRAEEDIERRLPVLSTFLGHSHVRDTYWYLSSHPELMKLATSRLEQRWGGPHAE